MPSDSMVKSVPVRGLSLETFPLIQPKRASFSSEGVKVWTYCAARLVLGNVEL